ncbi:RNA polymerase ECF-type sigma factor [Sphingobium sp. SYK-6]|uniref:RNA polymerase sigma factor n=1 Tax=Sphingobium sp. (strain NBRC 103272 / SYK-6) TaxID=627192 RepID=UPI00022771DA|nr:sigma-70 family RNA polymerase sigma factor [Sphingobium sp. SYK-6]BAK67556.1 RNA polymerase ECF-type sigma factor [Sphingobium sp. SYK-6]
MHSALVETHSRALRRYFMKRVPIGEVDDLVQEVLLNLQGRQKDAPIANIQGYMFTVAANVLARRYRRNNATILSGDEAPEPVDPISPERILLGQRDLASALDVIRNLPDRTRQIFILHRFEEMTYARIASRLGISVSAVEKHIMLALRALNARAGDEE